MSRVLKNMTVTYLKIWPLKTNNKERIKRIFKWDGINKERIFKWDSINIKTNMLGVL